MTVIDRRRLPTLDEAALADLVTGLLSARQIWQDAARFDPTCRQPVRLLADQHFEAWVIGWCPGQSLGLHDHGPSAAAIVVAEGRLRETSVVETAAGPRHEAHALERGVVRPIAPGVVHAIENRESSPATSLHVYSPPLDRMTHFEPDGVRALETVGVEPVTPVLPPMVGQLLRIARHI